jgi:hypothetical protein
MQEVDPRAAEYDSKSSGTDSGDARGGDGLNGPKRTSWTPEVGASGLRAALCAFATRLSGPWKQPSASSSANGHGQPPRQAGDGSVTPVCPVTQEDARLMQLVEKYGPQNWTLIAQVRTTLPCRRQRCFLLQRLKPQLGTACRRTSLVATARAAG